MVPFGTSCNSLEILVTNLFSMLIIHLTSFITTIVNRLYSIVHVISLWFRFEAQLIWHGAIAYWRSLILSSSQVKTEINRLWTTLQLWIYKIQTQTEMNLKFKQRIKSRTPTGIEFSGFNRDQSIKPVQLQLLWSRFTQEMKQI